MILLIIYIQNKYMYDNKIEKEQFLTYYFVNRIKILTRNWFKGVLMSVLWLSEK